MYVFHENKYQHCNKKLRDSQVGKSSLGIQNSLLAQGLQLSRVIFLQNPVLLPLCGGCGARGGDPSSLYAAAVLWWRCRTRGPPWPRRDAWLVPFSLDTYLAAWRLLVSYPHSRVLHACRGRLLAKLTTSTSTLTCLRRGHCLLVVEFTGHGTRTTSSTTLPVGGAPLIRCISHRCPLVVEVQFSTTRTRS